MRDRRRGRRANCGIEHRAARVVGQEFTAHGAIVCGTTRIGGKRLRKRFAGTSIAPQRAPSAHFPARKKNPADWLLPARRAATSSRGPSP
jgi:hypothetical protein